MPATCAGSIGTPLVLRERSFTVTMRTILTLIVAMYVSSLAAQVQQRPITLSLKSHAGSPTGEFNEEWGRGFAGLSANFSTPMKRLPFEGGLQFDWSHMGREKAVVPINEEYIDATEGDLVVNNSIYGFHSLVRLKPFTGKVAPYVDGLAGLRSFSSRTKVKVDGEEGPIRNERNHRDGTFSYGWAAGVMVAWGRTLFVEGRFEKLQGGEVTYVDPSTVDIDPGGAVTYETRTSNTDAWSVHLGIGFRF